MRRTLDLSHAQQARLDRLEKEDEHCQVVGVQGNILDDGGGTLILRRGDGRYQTLPWDGRLSQRREGRNRAA